MPNNHTTDERIFITAKEAAAMLSISMPTMYELTHCEGFPAMKCGKKVLVNVEGLRRWAAEKSGMHI